MSFKHKKGQPKQQNGAWYTDALTETTMSFKHKKGNQNNKMEHGRAGDYNYMI
jgi:hypothetical protein